MQPPRQPRARISEIAIRVRNLERSADFYREVLGLDVQSGDPPDAGTRICSSKGSPCVVVLIQGLPRSFEPVGLDRLSLAVARAEDLDELVRAALAHGVQVIRPRLYGGRYQAFLFDPDGYKIAIVAPAVPKNVHGAEIQPVEAGQTLDEQR